jgi:hypothetical protein
MSDPKEVALALEMGTEGLFGAPREEKVKIIKEWLDLNIGTEPTSEIKEIPGIPMLTGEILEQVSDVFIGAIAELIAKKLAGGMGNV